MALQGRQEAMFIKGAGLCTIEDHTCSQHAAIVAQPGW